ncbi:MAG: Ig-like domain-containing protein [Proteobacteria bacterium]|nr:Ig-like domain-containing protein [Pseudomonadota bacterium]MCP4921024.1 Ig-like domain-containing protein [Pseudomonadota bacterium]
MTRFALPALALLAFAAGCTGDDGTINTGEDSVPEVDADTDTDADSDSDSDADTDSDTDTDCEIAISYLDPGNNTNGVSPTPTLKAWFDSDATLNDITLSLEGPDGDIAGTTELLNGATGAGFTPGEELARSTQYTFNVETCTDDASSTFTTVEGEIDPSDLQGRVYDIDLNSVTWNSPAESTGSLLVGQLDTDHILILVESVDDDTIVMTGAMGWTDSGTLEQYACAEAINFPDADFSANPYFQAGPDTTTFDAGGYQIPVTDFVVSGSFDDGGDNLVNVSVEGYVDLDGLEFSGYAACDLLALSGDSCIACPDDGDEQCVYLDVEDDEAPYESSVSVDPDIDPSANPDCN